MNGVANILQQNNSKVFSEAVLEVMENEDFYEKNIQKLSSQNLWDSNKTILN